MGQLILTRDFAWNTVGKPKIGPQIGITDVRVSVALIFVYCR
jgi:hypothetical protein